MIELGIGAIVLSLLGFWYEWCNDKAYRQRYEMIISYPTNPRAYLVPLSKHTWYLMTCRDPRRLYKVDLREGIKAGRVDKGGQNTFYKISVRPAAPTPTKLRK